MPDPHAQTRPDLVRRDFRPDPAALDTRWCGDITYIATGEGRLHLATVIDIASRRVAGWATADHLGTSLAADTLKATCHQRQPEGTVVFHSDHGSQYTSQVFATLKNELVSQRRWHSRSVARSAIFDYIEGWYNTRRLHSSLGYQSPAEYETTAA
ncbi:DDE-type integrase/transposase/recombinase [Streptomyces sp. NPDC002054]|uniref:DDE-type integrase/transposase/recombinase n=1 Tax=Streptomyces sp. NPDC002054 TaxID=3154663 RepID=UPI00332552C5